MINFKIFGVKIEISFLLICFLNLVLISYGEFVLFWCVFSALFHEFCHVVCLLFFGVKPSGLQFQVNGVVLKSKMELADFKKAIVLVAGCAGNFVLLLFFCLIKFNFAMVVNLFLLVFNMLPHEKLDGGQLLSIALKKFDAVTSLKICSLVSKLVFGLLLIMSVVFTIKFKNYTLLFFVIMLNFLN